MTETKNTWPELLNQLLKGDDLSVSQAKWAMQECISGAASQVQLAAMLVALRGKGVAVSELLGFSEATLSAAVKADLPSRALDIVGTGGDGHNTINVSTTAAILLAGAGVPVIKHGNRAVSSKSGASDVLTALGASHELAPAGQEKVFDETGLVFLHAGKMHPGFANIAPVRADLKIPTVFNFLGPLVNPAQPQAIVLGVARAELGPLLAEVLASRGQVGLVVCGGDGMDEITVTTTSRVWQVAGGQVTEFELDPEKLGIPLASLDDVRGGSPAENAEILRDTLAGKKQGAMRDIVLLSAAAGIVAFDLLDEKTSLTSLETRFISALEKAGHAIESGSALAVLERWITATNEHAD
ncbi:MAG: anthranilate phosphoribosyltransferase [Microbacteriaceae bacterium]|nr:anthranilate phosphoribosyltransferase [Microbacteriaceae bacterium]